MTNDLKKSADYAAVKNEITADKAIGAVSKQWANRVNQLAELIGSVPQVDMHIEHHLHAGVYSRTGLQPAGVLCAAAMLKVPTQLIVSGKCRIYCDGNEICVDGYKVLDGLPGRQVVVYTEEDTWATALFATEAKTVAEAEAEAVGEDVAMKLLNNRGDKTCLDLQPEQLLPYPQ